MHREFDKYIGIPFVHRGRTKNGVDCYGLITLIYKSELGINLFDIETYQKKWYEKHNLFINNYYRQWGKIDIDKLQVYDVILFSIGDSKLIPSHVGLYIGEDRFIHCMENSSVIISKLYGQWRKVFHSAYRFRQEEK